MVVEVEKGLNEIRNYLINSGYTVVDSNYKGRIDAYVYHDLGIIEYNNLTQSTGLNGGILMINALNKTPQVIEKILDNRTYGDILNFH
ncbi:MAG: YkuS family protein [Clostridia bacterium]|nr:YkuS family protein [Clostridia bacterium]